MIGALLSRERRAEIAARAEAATAGHWARQGLRFVMSIPAYAILADANTHGIISDEHEACNADFIANARDDVPDLLAESAALRGLLRAALNEDQARRNVECRACHCKCNCGPSAKWLREAWKAGLHEEAP